MESLGKPGLFFFVEDTRRRLGNFGSMADKRPRITSQSHYSGPVGTVAPRRSQKRPWVTPPGGTTPQVEQAVLKAFPVQGESVAMEVARRPGMLQKLTAFLTTPLSLSRVVRGPKVLEAVEEQVQTPTLAQTLPSWLVGRPLMTKWDCRRAIKEGYEASNWVYACITILMRTCASVPWVVRKKVGDKEWEEQEDHPAALLLENPNDKQSGGELIERTVSHLMLCGNALWTKTRSVTGRKGILELWPMEPDGIKPVGDRRSLISRYEYQLGDVSYPDIPAENVVHFMLTNPGNPLWGISPLQAGSQTVDCEVDALRWWRFSLRQRCVKDGMLAFKHELSLEQFNEVQEILIAQSGPTNARLPLVIGSDATYTPFSMTPVEMDFIDSRKMTREEICALFGVPPPLLGIMDHATYNNIQMAQEFFWKNTIVPLLFILKGVLNRALLVEYGTPAQLKDLEIDFDVTNVEALQEEFKEKVATAKDLFAMGVPFNTINKRLKLGLPDIEGGDIGFVSSSLVPTDNPEEEPAVQVEPIPAGDEGVPPQLTGQPAKVTPITTAGRWLRAISGRR